jgi:hypothetical protein
MPAPAFSVPRSSCGGIALPRFSGPSQALYLIVPAWVMTLVAMSVRAMVAKLVPSSIFVKSYARFWDKKG